MYKYSVNLCIVLLMRHFQYQYITITCYFTAHLVFHWCLYNKQYYELAMARSSVGLISSMDRELRPVNCKSQGSIPGQA